jgi:hypothetical protein
MGEMERFVLRDGSVDPWIIQALDFLTYKL